MDSVSLRRKAVLFLILSAVLWSTGGVMIKAISWQPISIMAGRSIFSSILFLIYLRRWPRHFTPWKITASIAHILTAFLFVTATKLTTAANAIFLQYTAPIYIVLLGMWFLRERPSRTDWASMGIIFAGMVLFFGDKLSMNGFYGNLLAVLSGVTMAVMNVSLRAQKDGTPADSIFVAHLFTAVVGFPFVLKETWTFIFFTSAIKHVPAIEATLISTLEPVLNPVWVFLFLGEEPGRLALLGGLIVLGGVALNAVGTTRTAAEPAPT
jgi:drug/metabolite transporter (DMT)-like permease